MVGRRFFARLGNWARKWNIQIREIKSVVYAFLLFSLMFYDDAIFTDIHKRSSNICRCHAAITITITHANSPPFFFGKCKCIYSVATLLKSRILVWFFCGILCEYEATALTCQTSAKGNIFFIFHGLHKNTVIQYRGEILFQKNIVYL